MATDRLVKVTNDKGEETIERVPEGTVDDLRRVGADVEDPKTGQKNTGRPVYEAMSPEDGRNVAMDIAKCLRDALREHGDEMKAIYLSNSTNEGVSIRVQYMPDEQGRSEEDEFEFRWPDGVVKLDNVANPVELGQLQKQSGTTLLQKDLAKAALLNFLKKNDTVDSSEQQPSQEVDSNAMPDGPVAEEQLWESEECQNAFCQAVDMYRQSKDKESIKNLFRAARPYQKGNTIQEKLKGAVEWYNIYKENPPKNTKDQVFLEDGGLEEGNVPEVITALQNISKGLDILKTYINRTEDTHLGAYYRELESKYESLFDFCKRQVGGLYGFFDDKLSEVWDVNDPIANGEDTNYPFGRDNDEFNSNFEDYGDDEPVVHEGDEFGPEVGDSVDYNGGTYKLYGYCGHQIVLQNVDDERDFKLVTPDEIAGNKSPKEDLEETTWVDPDNLTDDELSRV